MQYTCIWHPLCLAHSVPQVTYILAAILSITLSTTACLQNSPYWEITAGFIGSVKATVPITTLSTDSCQAVLDEILLTVKPRSLQHPSVHGISASAHLSGSNLLAADLDDQPVAQDIMTDGIMQIAGGIETIVQQLQLQVPTTDVSHNSTTTRNMAWHGR